MGQQRNSDRGRGRRVKLMADYGAFPLWGIEARPGDYEWSGMLSPEQLPLSAELVKQLEQWATSHDETLGPTFEWLSEAARKAFVDEGWRLLRLVQAELGPAGYEVVYYNEITGRLEE